MVEFIDSQGRAWTGNFAPGLGSVSTVLPHPDGRRVLVAAEGALWSVDPDARVGEELSGAVDALWPIREPDGFVMSRQGLAFLRLGPSGVLWRTRRLSWDGFDQIRLDESTLSGLAWNPLDDRWDPFTVDLATGASTGGSFHFADAERWEELAPGFPAV